MQVKRRFYTRVMITVQTTLERGFWIRGLVHVKRVRHWRVRAVRERIISKRSHKGERLIVCLALQ